MLDTNLLSELARVTPDTRVVAKWNEHNGDYATASVVLHELRYGISRTPAGQRRRALERFFSHVVLPLNALPYDRDAALWHAATRADLEARGLTPSHTDAQIAATAAVNDLVLVTRNTRDFAHLDVEVTSWHSQE